MAVCLLKRKTKMFETLKALIQETKPSIYLLVSDDIVDSSDEDNPMVSCSIQWVWQDDKGNFATLETYGIVAPPAADVVDIDTLHYDFSDCTGEYSCGLNQEEEWALDDVAFNRALDFNLKHNPYTVELCY